MSNRDDIDRLLRESGERWRSKPLPLPSVDDAMFVDRPQLALSAVARRWLSAAAAFAVLALVVAVALATVLPHQTGPGAALSPTATTSTASPIAATSPPSSDTPIATLTPSAAQSTPRTSATPLESNAPMPPPPAIVRDGDTVVAYGNLFETATPSQAFLCRWADGFAPDIGCLGSVVVTVRGVDVRELPGTEADPSVPELPAGTWVSTYIRVEGVWRGEAIEATHVERAERPSTRELLALPDVPCARPPDGWAGYPPDPGLVDQADAALRSEVSEHPDEYAGISFAVTTDEEGRISELVRVVGTLVDVESVSPKLHSIYPFNLCIVRVEHSSSELQEIADDLFAFNRDWEILIDTSVGRVGVYVPVFDQGAADAVAPYSSTVLIRPVVVRFAR